MLDRIRKELNDTYKEVNTGYSIIVYANERGFSNTEDFMNEMLDTDVNDLVETYETLEGLERECFYYAMMEDYFYNNKVKVIEMFKKEFADMRV